MNHIRVVSSNIHSIAYDSESNILEISFLNGGLYSYSSVPEDIFKSLMSASSHGSYFASHIRNVFPFVKIR
jgi:hypothetical protein